MNPVMALFRILFICFSVIASAFSQSSDFYIKTFAVENGLSHNQVRSIDQDHYGFLWIATLDGICRFDGYEFRKYFHDPGDTNTIDHSFLFHTVVDKKDNVWVVGASAKVAKYNRTFDRFSPINFKFKEISPGGSIYEITKDNQGNLWGLCDHGIFSYDSERDKYIEYPFPEPFPVISNEITVPRISVDHTGDVWIICFKDIYHYSWSGSDKYNVRLIYQGHCLIPVSSFMPP